MNSKLRNLLTNNEFICLVREGLPYAFEVANSEHRRRQGGAVGPEVGITRERIVLGLLTTQLGKDNVILSSSNNAMQEIAIAGMPLDIKTATKNGSVKAKWTVDDRSAQEVIDSFEFKSDLLLVRIWWNEERDSVFYVPREVLVNVAKEWDGEYLNIHTGTNNRGIEIVSAFMRTVESHDDTLRLSIQWHRSNEPLPDPIDRWIHFWSNPFSFNQI